MILKQISKGDNHYLKKTVAILNGGWGCWTHQILRRNGEWLIGWLVWFMVFNATFNNISVILWQSKYIYIKMLFVASNIQKYSPNIFPVCTITLNTTPLLCESVFLI
jgi:hypothetical protein